MPLAAPPPSHLLDRFFAPRSLAVYGLSANPRNTPRIMAENCLRWGFRGRIYGINPAIEDTEIGGIRVYRRAVELPETPDLAALLIPARYVPEAVEDCGRAGIGRLAVLSGGFNESGDSGRDVAEQLRSLCRQYGIRFVGPNCLALADTESGLCLPFVPACPMRRGGFSLVTQSGGLGLFLLNLLEAEQIGLAKFASIGNKLDLGEIEFLDHLGQDPATRVIGLYLESIGDGRRLIEAAERTGKPVIILKAGATAAGSRAAMSHTAALASNETLVDAAFDRAGIIRIESLREFVTTAKAFDLPPMRGKRIMAMSPAGGLGVAMADLCERAGFEFADPGAAFYRELATTANAGIIRPANPLDMGDIYRIDLYPHIFSRVLGSEAVDGAIFVSQRPRMPEGGQDVFTAMFTADITLAATGVTRSADKPLALVYYGHGGEIAAMKRRLSIPIFDGPEEAVSALARQQAFHARRAAGRFAPDPAPERDLTGARQWLAAREGEIGEETLELLGYYGLAGPRSAVAASPAEAVRIAAEIGLPVALKVISPDALHKTEAGGVLTGIATPEEAGRGFARIRDNLERSRPGARFAGVRVAAMAPDGTDLFIGGLRDPAFGPVVLFGAGGIQVELFADVERVLCPSSLAEIEAKLKRLKVHRLLAGFRGRPPIDTGPFVRAILSVGQLLVDFPEIVELDCNPVRLLDQGRLLALDARMRTVAQ